MRSVHLEGMGLVGSMVAWHLWKKGIEFTWNDTDERIRAWEASSGLIYPSGDPVDALAYQVWQQWYAGKAPWTHDPRFADILESSAFWYCTKSAPNGSSVPPRFPALKELRCSTQTALTLDVPRFVLKTRRCFASKERDRAPDGTQRLVAHGFHKQRLDHYVWGWTADVELDVNPKLLSLTPGERPLFYLRVGRFQFGYANPRPGSSHWVAGSSHLVQHEPKSYDIPPKFDSWLKFFREQTYGLVKVRPVSDPIEGWRPAPATHDTSLEFTETDGVLYAPALGGNGVRYAPYYCRSVLKLLEGTPVHA